MTPVAPTTLAAEAKRERAKREKARRDFIAFSEYIAAPWYKAARHHRLVAESLTQVARYIETKGAEGIGRLMVFEPPRHGKTEQVAQLFPAWLLGRQPNTRVILTAYGAGLAQKSSRAVRSYLTGQRYQAIFGELSAIDAPIQLSDDSRAVTDWDLAAPARGGVVAAGIGGGITGHGAHLFIIDDPFKSRDEAESETYRAKAMEWYSSSAYTRLEDGAAIIIIHTRWHPDDLAGQLLKRMVTGGELADQWTVIDLPALAWQPDELAVDSAHQLAELSNGLYLSQSDPLERQPGQALWPAKYDVAALQKIDANSDPYDWSALYQQRPRPHTGGFFEPPFFKNIIARDQVPQGLTWVRYVDLAISEKSTADFNATVAEALDKDGNIYLRDMIRVRGWYEFKEQMIAAMLSDLERGTLWFLETVAFQSLAFQDLLRDPRLARVALQGIKPEGDKVSRARPLQTRGRTNKIILVAGPWVAAFIAEALSFPKGRHDDQIDSASGGLECLSDQIGPLFYDDEPDDVGAGLVSAQPALAGDYAQP